MKDKRIDWERLGDSYPPRLVSIAKHALGASGPASITVDFLMSEWPGGDEPKALALLRDLVEMGILTQTIEAHCKCTALLNDAEVRDRQCTTCGEQFDSNNPWPATKLIFHREAPVSRDVRWLLALHGMNTTGAWQEEFNWLVSRTYGYSVPVAIYKYGIIRPGAFLRFRHKRLAHELASRISRLVGQTKESGFGGVPDVIAHSLGTLLLGEALISDPSLKVGRVILTGSILPPDFDWKSLISDGRVEAVLNHVGTSDFWANVAHYFVPESGPSGRVGFNKTGDRIVQHRSLGLGHNEFFEVDRLAHNFTMIWEPFLTDPSPCVKRGPCLGNNAQKEWVKAPWIVRLLPRCLLLLAFAILAWYVILIQVLGISAAARWLGRWL